MLVMLCHFVGIFDGHSHILLKEFLEPGIAIWTNGVPTPIPKKIFHMDRGDLRGGGVVLKLELQYMLRHEFTFDLVEEVGKGVKGADVIQTVRNRFDGDCGKFIFETTRTKAFSTDWLPKLKADAVMVKAELCVLATETLPVEIERIGQVDGVWICSFAHAKGLVLVLRDSLVRINEALSSQANRGEKI